LTGAGAADLAKIFEEIRYPGIGLADVAVDRGESACYFRCADFDSVPPDARFFFSGAGHFLAGEGCSPSFDFLEFYQDWLTGRFFDPQGIYPQLRQCLQGSVPPELPQFNPGVEYCRALMDWALILSRYFADEPSLNETQHLNKARLQKQLFLFDGLPKGPPPGLEEQRFLLSGLMSAPNPGMGLEFLKSRGFIKDYWPELAVLDDVEHSKEFHPEGNVWKHTLETFRYRKTAGGAYDLRLSLGLLLHDMGKARAGAAGSHRFEGHAELGERQARRFLERLGFGSALVADVCFLVRNHMLPAALPRLSLSRTEGVMASPLFPTLLELYRCDESSSFKGLDGDYESSAAYRSYLRYRRNPYRSADGKKLKRDHTQK
jgi:poly(A) polymerase